jgi:ketosteroid isomerase-like protein
MIVMSVDENKALVRRFFALGPSRGDLKAAGELLASDFALHVPLPCSPGVQGMNDVITACRAAFEHLDVTVETMVAEGEMVAARFTARGVHDRPPKEARDFSRGRNWAISFRR